MSKVEVKQKLTDKYYKQDLCDSESSCKLYNPLLTQGECYYYNEWCELKDKIADLEAKLAESNESHHKNIVELTKMETKKDRKIEELKQQLAEKEKEYQSFKKIADENVNYLKNRILEETKNHNQDKISFTVEQLEQLRHDIWTNQADDGYTDMQVDLYDLNDVIDVRIMQIKEGK